MIKILIGVAIGYCVERFFGIRIKKGTDGAWYIHYNTGSGARNKKKLF